MSDIPDSGRADITITGPESNAVMTYRNVEYEIIHLDNDREPIVYIYPDEEGTRGPRPPMSWCDIRPLRPN